MTPLGMIVGARSGDKGGAANLGVWVREPSGAADAPLADARYAWLLGFLTVERLQELLPETAALQVRRYEFANLRAVNFVIAGLLGRGVAETGRSDPQAKGLGEHLRARLVEIPAVLLERR